MCGQYTGGGDLLVAAVDPSYKVQGCRQLRGLVDSW